MFHHSNFIMLFYIFFASAALIIFLQINATAFASRQNTAYSVKVTSASQAAMDSVDYEKLLEGMNVWEEKTSRDTALNVFYNTLSRSLGETRINDNIQVSTPLILFVDRDGYYIGWNATFDVTNMADVGKENEFVNSLQVTRLIPWSVENNGYTIRYSLYGDIISVVTPEGVVYKDKKKIPTDVMSLFTTLTKSEVKTAIVEQTQQTIEKYINEYNKSAVINNAAYALEMPTVAGEAWHRLLENPTFIAFFQGTNINTGRNIISAYAYAGSETNKKEKWIITPSVDGTLPPVYHNLTTIVSTGEASLVSTSDAEGNSVLNIIVDPSHYGSNGTYTEVKLYGSAEECAEHGAVPCPDCVYGLLHE